MQGHFRTGGVGRRAFSVALAVVVACGALLSGFNTPRVAEAAPLIHWGYYVTYAKDSFTALQANVGAYTMVSPYYFELQADGTIKNMEEADTNALLHKNNVKILPMVKNDLQGADFTAQIATPEARDKLATTIADLVVPRNYDGINVDIEDVRPADRALLSDLMSRIAAKIRPSGKLITQAIVGKAKDGNTGYGGAFDYAALAPSVDYALIMAYDYHYAGGDAGPVAPINWVRDVATYAASTFGPGKTLLGVPLYGYDWNVTTGGVAKAVNYSQALARSQKPGATRTLDTASMSEVVRYADDDGNQHETWFESAATFNAKLRLVREAGLAGFGLWRIGQEDTGVYETLRRGDTPAARAGSLGGESANHTYVADTGHNISNSFKLYYDQNGGVARFGLPLTEEFTERNPADDKTYTVQYFERARFEYHSESASVVLGGLGTEALAIRTLPTITTTTQGTSGQPTGQASGIVGGPSSQTSTASSATTITRSPTAPIEQPAAVPPDKRYFPETKHLIGGAFKQYWEATNGLALLGYPISEEFTENGKTIQYFQRARLELNPAAATPDARVQTGLLGTELLRARGWVQ